MILKVYIHTSYTNRTSVASISNYSTASMAVTRLYHLE